MGVPGLEHLPGTTLPEGSFMITEAEQRRLADSLGNPSDGGAHPVWAYIATQRGIGISVAELCALADFDVNDGPMLGSVEMTYARPLELGVEYRVTGEVVGIERKHGRAPPLLHRLARRRRRSPRSRRHGHPDPAHLTPNKDTPMPSGPFAHVCLLVNDLDQAVEDWTKILRALDPGQLEQPIVRYDEFEGGADRMRWATFVSDHGAEIQLMEPARDTPLGRRLEKVGEHVHHVCFTTDDPAAVARRLAEEGLQTSPDENSDPGMPWQRWTWVLPKSAHGTLVEVARRYKAVDGRWENGSAS